jgi:hypothetical protein
MMPLSGFGIWAMLALWHESGSVCLLSFHFLGRVYKELIFSSPKCWIAFTNPAM